jgi:signal peptidase
MRKISIFLAILLSLSFASAFPECRPGDRNVQKLAYMLGESMQPSISEGDSVWMKRRNFYYEPKIETGDIIVFKYKPENYDLKQFLWKPTWIVHRVYGIVPGGYLTKGDNNEYEDPEPIPRKAIVGVVCKIKSNQG